MKIFLGSIVWLSCAFFAISVCEISASAQSNDQARAAIKNGIPAFQLKKAINEALREKGHGGFLMITPSELKAAAAADSASRSDDLGDPCSLALEIEFGQTLNGQLANTDCQLDDSSYADFYLFNALAGERATIDMRSGFVDSFLGLANQSGTFVVADDDSGGAPHARIDVTLPETGLYLILANSAFPNQFGAYTLALNGGPNCTFTFDPPSGMVPAAGGTFNVNVTTGPRCYWTTGSVFSEVSTSSFGLGSGTFAYSVSPNTGNQVRVLNLMIRSTPYNIRQDPIACSYSFSPSSISVGPDGGNGTVSVTATNGCLWSGSSPGYFISASGSHIGSGTFNYSIGHNNGNDRTSWLEVDGHQIPVTQTGLNCSFLSSASVLSAGPAGANGNFVINTQPGCRWFLDRNQLWLEVPNGLGNGSGPATIPYHIQPLLVRMDRDAVIQLFYELNGISNSSAAFVDQIGRFFPSPSDLDGDGKTDLTIYRPADGNWYSYRSSGGGATVVHWGIAGDVPAPADYDGDGKVDRAMYRPSTGEWLILRTSDSTVNIVTFGVAGDRPVPGDYDRDGKADIAQFRPSDGTWYVYRSSFPHVDITKWGEATDIPVPGDYNGDGIFDLAVYRPSTGLWYEFLSRQAGSRVVSWGMAADVPVPADYDGDGKTDIAQFRPSDGNWYIFRSLDGGVSIVNWGTSTDLPVPGDYDGDAIADPAVFRNGTWFAIRSTGGPFIANWGSGSDIPIASPRFQ